MSGSQFLADTSVFSRLSKPQVAQVFSKMVAQSQVAICAPVAFELSYSARNHDDYVALTDRLLAFTEIPVNAADHGRALAVQAKLSERGQHRALSLVDALVAAVAEERGLTILHYDSDFELVAEITGQPQQWVVKRGSVD